jgi:transposase
MDRTQVALFSPTLDQVIAPDHPVRLFDEILRGLDWSAWEACYVLVQGQPPIHPRLLASVLLYGLSQGIRSSRRLEWATANALDFLWLADGRRVDHSTFCDFRKARAPELKTLFRQIGRVAMDLGLVQLNQVALDGTRLKASSSRHGTAAAATLEQRLAALDKQVDAALAQFQQTDQHEQELFETTGGYEHLPRGLADLKARQQRLAQALARARQEQQAKGKQVAVAVADPEAPIAPNKEGGFAPNYTPTVTVDAAAGLIVAADVLEDSDESEALVGAMTQVRENLDAQPQQVLADAGFSSGPNLEAMRQRHIEALIPSASRHDPPDNPARRQDPRQPVAAENWDKLPLDRSTRRLGRTAFVYGSAQDCYWCPLGKALGFQRRHDKLRRKGMIEYRVYECRDCDGCPLRQRCLSKHAQRRIIERDAHEPLREAMDVRLRSPSGQAAYRLRAWLVEGTFGVIKSVLGIRQFLLRGLANVRTEWTWMASAFNLRKLARHLASRRQSLPAAARPA